MSAAAADDATQQRQCISDDDAVTEEDSDTLTADHAVQLPSASPYTPAAAGHDDEPTAAAAVDSGEASDIRQRAMYARFRSWTQRNYGEAGKTKTVTRAKYERVVAILSGVEPPTADNSKLRFWIKAKGFRLGYPVDTDPPAIMNGSELYIPSKTWVCVASTCNNYTNMHYLEFEQEAHQPPIMKFKCHSFVSTRCNF